MINLKNASETVSLDLPEATFGVSYNRYKDVSIQYYYIPSITHTISRFLSIIVKKNTLYTRKITLDNVALSYLDTLQGLVNYGRSNMPQTSLTLTLHDSVWKGTIVDNEISFIKNKKGFFTVSFNFVGRKLS